MNELLTLYILIPVLILILFGFVGIVIIVSRVFSITSAFLKLTESNKNAEIQSIKDTAIHEAEQLIDDANKNSLNIIAQANDKATQILQNTDKFSSDLKQDFDTLLSQITESHKMQLANLASDLMSNFEKSAQNELSLSETTFHTFSQKLEESVNRGLADINVKINQTFEAIQKSIEMQVSSKLDSFDAELISYKNMKIQKINEILPLLAQEALLNALSNTFSPDFTQEYVQSILKEELKSSKI